MHILTPNLKNIYIYILINVTFILIYINNFDESNN